MTVLAHPDLHHLLRSAVVDSPTAFSIRGKQVTTAPDQLLPVLESELYDQLYCGPFRTRTSLTEDPAEALAFIGALSQANTGTGAWEPGWLVSGEQDASVTVIRDGVTFWAERDQVRTATGSLTPGQHCSVRIGKEMRHLLFGFYMALGDLHTGDGGPEPVPLVRLYWHLTPETAVRYMRTATVRLNGAGIPFQTKVASNPRQYVRRDNGVLYLRRADFAPAVPILQTIYQAVRDGLRPEVPLFTKPLAPGLSLAESPQGGKSFGQSRCHTAAQALWQCHVQGVTDPDLRLETLAATFAKSGIDPERPYLEPGSADSYEIDLACGEGGPSA